MKHKVVCVCICMYQGIQEGPGGMAPSNSNIYYSKQEAHMKDNKMNHVPPQSPALDPPLVCMHVFMYLCILKYSFIFSVNLPISHSAKCINLPISAIEL